MLLDIYYKGGGEKEWLNNRVNLSLIFNHTASLFASSAPNLRNLCYRSLPVSKLVPVQCDPVDESCDGGG